jgi:hypothetical protein
MTCQLTHLGDLSYVSRYPRHDVVKLLIEMDETKDICEMCTDQLLSVQRYASERRALLNYCSIPRQPLWTPMNFLGKASDGGWTTRRRPTFRNSFETSKRALALVSLMMGSLTTTLDLVRIAISV